MKLLVILFLFILIFGNFQAFAGWTSISTNINDEYTSVVGSYGYSYGFITGRKGIYYTTNTSIATPFWNKIIITGNTIDSLLFIRCVFNRIATPTSPGYLAFASGRDTVNNIAVILKIDLSTLNHSFVYIGSTGSKINDIKAFSGTVFYAAGDNGLIIRSKQSVVTNLNSGTTLDLNAVGLSGSYVDFAGDGIYIKANENAPVFTLETYFHPGVNIKCLASPTIAGGFGGGSSFYQFTDTGNAVNQINRYNYGPLNARRMYTSGNIIFVATDHGIFKTDNTYSFLEYQPSTGYELTDIWVSQTASPAFAIGPNRLLLKGNAVGDATITMPYSEIIDNGACKGSSLGITGFKGTGFFCKWLVNNVVVSSNCSFGYVFADTGSYTIKYVVENIDHSLWDTASRVITVTESPTINLPFFLSDTLICKKEKIDVTIQNTQPGIRYDLVFAGKSTSLGSGIGNGGTIIFTSNFIDSTAKYSIRAVNIQGGCAANFTIKYSITVEKTKAQFASSLINAEIGEPVRFHQLCGDARFFYWDFGANASVNSSDSALTEPVQFNSLGSTTIKLICWSAAGCYDSIIAPGPFIYDEPVGDTCWAMNLDEIDPLWMGQDNFRIRHMIKYKNKILIAGTNYKTLFKSRIGLNSGRIESGGEFSFIHTTGVLKWIARSINSDYDYLNATTKPSITSIDADSSGNIYAAGVTEYKFVTQLGDTVDFRSSTMPCPSLGYDRGGSSIFKLDSFGNVIWHSRVTGTRPLNIKIDKAGNLYFMVSHFSTYSNLFYFNQDSCTELYSNFTGDNDDIILKINPAGTLLWRTRFTSSNAVCLNIDNQQNMYVLGVYGSTVTFFSSNNSVGSSLSGSSTNPYLVKYDSTGMFKWKVSAKFSNNYSVGSFGSYSMVADENGFTYVPLPGSNTANMVITNADGSNFTTSRGSMHIVKFSPSGKVVFDVGDTSVILCTRFGICLSGDKVAAAYRTINNPYSLDAFYSISGIPLTVSLNSNQLVFASYDTSGQILSIRTANTDNYRSLASIALVDNDQLIFAADYGLTYYGSSILLLNDSLHLNGQDGVLAKISYNGCTNIITSIEKKTRTDFSFQVFPNPISGFATVILDNEINNGIIRILNLLGSEIIRVSISGKNKTIALNTLTPGLYFIEISGSKEFYARKKIIVE